MRGKGGGWLYLKRFRGKMKVGKDIYYLSFEVISLQNAKHRYMSQTKSQRCLSTPVSESTQSKRKIKRHAP
jgi:hypothetical protein